MKNIVILIILVMSNMVQGQTSIHEFSFKSINGESKSFADFKGKKILIVNTASECGFTGQYEDLQILHETHKNNLVIIGFPANNFGGQEPGENNEIATFCKKNYGVSFLMAEKVSVKGEDISPVFSWLNGQDNPDFKGDINWNFEKYLLDEKGQLIGRYRSAVKPNSPEIIGRL